MKIKLLAALTALGISGNTLAAVCTVAEPPNYQTEKLETPATVIELRADAPISPTTPIAQIRSTALSQPVHYFCDSTTLIGNRPIIVPDIYPNYDGMYKTKIDGIGVKFTTSAPSGGPTGALPRYNIKYTADEQEGGGSRYIAPQGIFIASFYKLGNVDLNTSYPLQALLFSAGEVGSNNIENNAVSTYYMNPVQIVSTPVCKVDSPSPVDFGTVVAAEVRQGVKKPLQFGIECKTDYGSYGVIASIKADSATTDGRYIKVRDSKNNEESLFIAITDDKGSAVMVDNSTKISQTGLKSGQKANFGWQAELKKQDGTPYPAPGEFRASAIITLDVK
ncbi:fimbrial protein [Morganella morganii]|uniref:fimbrial protein n=1 Tax=Morganella morganii TaxID=582 RepID=UPI0021D2A85F|nr:fimbrial protein [Morganella morganii]MCU6237771.1 fimbrial protein [Morganella morganii]